MNCLRNTAQERFPPKLNMANASSFSCRRQTFHKIQRLARRKRKLNDVSIGVNNQTNVAMLKAPYNSRWKFNEWRQLH
jgi:septation ring formation regulator EzrA